MFFLCSEAYVAADYLNDQACERTNMERAFPCDIEYSESSSVCNTSYITFTFSFYVHSDRNDT